MSQTAPDTLTGQLGEVALHRWSAAQPTFAVLLAHGYAEHARRYDHVAERLVAAGAAVLAPDHHHHGASEGTKGDIPSLDPLVDDLDAARKLLAGEHPDLPLVLVGHSMGGLLSTLLVQRDPSPFAAVVLSGPFYGNPGFEALLGMDPIPEVPLDPGALSRDPTVGEAYLADPLVYSGPIQRSTLEAMLGGVKTAAAGPSFGELPVLWIHGEHDQLAIYEVAKGVFEHLRGPGTAERSFPEAQHEIFNETNKDEVLDAVVSFLAGQGVGGG